ncbi:MAG: hypothetical protein IKX59_08965 [Bacteroidales bacterium]|nr:hypothetical protein [Bacteroidales bacterium]
MTYKLQDLDELLGYMWLKPNVTNINVDIFVDDGEAYIRDHHVPLLFVRNGYGREVSEFIPISISDSPTILDRSIKLNIDTSIIDEVVCFIQTNKDLLLDMANGKFLCYWAEVSGPIERYFKNYNGYPIPNTFATLMLKVSPDSLRLSTEDSAHYERIIAGTWYEKMIFGMKDEEIYKAVVAAVEDYSKFLKEVHNIKEEDNHGLRYSLKQAMYIVENILRAYEEDGFNELVPSWYEALNDVVNTFKASESNRMVEDYLDYCVFLLENMPVLELHRLKI